MRACVPPNRVRRSWMRLAVVRVVIATAILHGAIHLPPAAAQMNLPKVFQVPPKAQSEPATIPIE